MPAAQQWTDWPCEPVLAPFSWAEGRNVLVSKDVFASSRYHLTVDEVFAVMALCPQHQFHLVTDFPERYHSYVRTITEDEHEWLTWRVEASFVLSKLGRQREAKGHGPVWPLANVALTNVEPLRPAKAPSAHRPDRGVRA